MSASTAAWLVHPVEQIAQRDVEEDRDDRQDQEGESDSAVASASATRKSGSSRQPEAGAAELAPGRPSPSRSATSSSAAARFVGPFTTATSYRTVGCDALRQIGIATQPSPAAARRRSRRRSRRRPRRARACRRSPFTSGSWLTALRAPRSSPSRFEHLARVEADRHLRPARRRASASAALRGPRLCGSSRGLSAGRRATSALVANVRGSSTSPSAREILRVDSGSRTAKTSAGAPRGSASASWFEPANWNAGARRSTSGGPR